jgi:hypothetical protein
MAGDKLKFSIGQAAVPCQPSYALVPERMGRGLDPGLLRVFFNNLLHTPGSEFAVPPRLE